MPFLSPQGLDLAQIYIHGRKYKIKNNYKSLNIKNPHQKRIFI